MRNWFNDRKAAQIAAFFCEKAGGEINMLKLVKLIYLSERESMRQSGFPMTNDVFVSMPRGPVNSTTLDLINGTRDSASWADLISDKANHMVALARQREDSDIDQLSEFDCDILEKVWAEFGSKNQWQLVEWTHRNCPEWEDPETSSSPIPNERILKFLEIENAHEMASDIAEQRRIDALFESLRA